MRICSSCHKHSFVDDWQFYNHIIKLKATVIAVADFGMVSDGVVIKFLKPAFTLARLGSAGEVL